MPGTRLSDLPRAFWLRIKHGDWRGLYTLPTRVDTNRLSSEARASLARADREVRERQNSILGTQHLLLGLLQAGGEVINDLLTKAGHSRKQIAEQIGERIPRGTVVWDEPLPVNPGESPSRPRFVGMTRRAVDAQERAFKLADKRGLTSVSSALLLEALVSDSRATAAQLLRDIGIDRKTLLRG
jgi:ATP-dependent Clp protease ATP-binding subunit ClpA